MWRRLTLLSLACLVLVACGASTIEVSTDPDPSSVDNPEEEYDDPPDTATPSTTPLGTGEVGERLCGPGALCASEFVLNNIIYVSRPAPPPPPEPVNDIVYDEVAATISFDLSSLTADQFARKLTGRAANL